MRAPLYPEHVFLLCGVHQICYQQFQLLYSNCAINIPASSILSYDCGVSLTIVLCIDINGTHIKNFIANKFNE
ncbi:hypothetical protein H5410_012527 [Solanum commersonii]|uniref:Uncharacterized protein n=1 Tax=Solanum commersonii TaxID=4109 RepID=A0A9J6ARV3_SOLCO|nr:hypothetical protein H5410_012527 [Solanum commersonii]